MNQKERLYTVNEAIEILKHSSQRLFEILASPHLGKVVYNYHLFITKSTTRKDV